MGGAILFRNLPDYSPRTVAEEEGVSVNTRTDQQLMSYRRGRSESTVGRCTLRRRVDRQVQERTCECCSGLIAASRVS